MFDFALDPVRPTTNGRPRLTALTGERCRLQQPFLVPGHAKTMSLADVNYLPETPAHDPEIEAINDEAFGPGRFARAAYKIREGGAARARAVLCRRSMATSSSPRCA